MKDAHKMDQTKHVTLDTLPVNTPCKITKELPFPQPKKRTNQHCKECKHTNMMTIPIPLCSKENLYRGRIVKAI
ncbi:hypothetical protein GYH30_000320 [Glycine max]|uniref:Uncharacterized protein n=1 Tax=Glycine max TaxID=3847 RepID=A0A0R0LB52_SOYBN|nr:hypothetical protein GYH30_000320 [Glycine max]